MSRCSCWLHSSNCADNGVVGDPRLADAHTRCRPVDSGNPNFSRMQIGRSGARASVSARRVVVVTGGQVGLGPQGSN